MAGQGGDALGASRGALAQLADGLDPLDGATAVPQDEDDEVAKAAAGGESTWRARVANECECSHAPKCAAQEAPDHSVAQYESLIHLEMTKLFGGDVHAWNVCNRTHTTVAL